MTGSTIEQLGAQFRIINRFFAVTFQAKTHIERLWVLVNFHFAYVAMTVLAVQSSCNMRAVVIMNEIRHHSDRHPLERLVVFHSGNQRFELFTGVGDVQLLVTPPAFGLRWQTGNRSA